MNPRERLLFLHRMDILYTKLSKVYESEYEYGFYRDSKTFIIHFFREWTDEMEEQLKSLSDQYQLDSLSLLEALLNPFMMESGSPLLITMMPSILIRKDICI